MPGKTRKTLSAMMPPLKVTDFEAKRDFARAVARMLIATRDLMNAHFLAEPADRVDGKLNEISYCEDDQGFYNVFVHCPSLDVETGRRNKAFVQINHEKDFCGKKKTELFELTEALHASFSSKGLRNICKEIAAYWQRIQADNRDVLSPISKPLRSLVEALEAMAPRKRPRG